MALNKRVAYGWSELFSSWVQASLQPDNDSGFSHQINNTLFLLSLCFFTSVLMSLSLSVFSVTDTEVFLCSVGVSPLKRVTKEKQREREWRRRRSPSHTLTHQLTNSLSPLFSSFSTFLLNPKLPKMYFLSHLMLSYASTILLFYPSLPPLLYSSLHLNLFIHYFSQFYTVQDQHSMT